MIANTFNNVEIALANLKAHPSGLYEDSRKLRCNLGAFFVNLTMLTAISVIP